MSGGFGELYDCVGELADVDRIYRLLLWDHEIAMPPSGASARAEQQATLARIRHSLLTGDRLGAALETAAGEASGLGSELVAVVEDDRRRATAVDPAIVVDSARASALALAAWRDARVAEDFSLVVHHLERRLDIDRAYARCFPEAEHPYEALMDRYTHGSRLADVRALLAGLREGLLDLLDEIESSGVAVDGSLVTVPLDEARREALFHELLREIGMRGSHWRFDGTYTALASGISASDVRIAADYREPGLLPLFGALHELGHGFYEAGFDTELDRTTLDAAASFALHESQARLWENFVGRSEAFWSWCQPRLAAAFPSEHGSHSPLDLFRAVNAVRRSPVRVDADELTYGLHVDVRFELELALVEGTLAVADLPAAWNDLYRERVGVADAPSLRVGVLQDDHWPVGMFGYFPNYSLGNVIAGQIWARVHRDLPQLSEEVAGGRFDGLREWLRERVHRSGRRRSAPATTTMVVGGSLDPEPFLAYLRRKLLAVHGMAGSGER